MKTCVLSAHGMQEESVDDHTQEECIKAVYQATNVRTHAEAAQQTENEASHTNNINAHSQG